jgi:hypothetical protein
MSGTSTLKAFLESRGIVLDSLGLQERALRRDDALHAVDLAKSAGVELLGGDVYVEKHGQLESAYANWYSEPRDGEAENAFVARSCAESRAYISTYPDPPDGVPVFVLVTGSQREGEC